MFEPVQLGFSPGGSERAAHLLQACAESGGLESIILKTDVKNAFNEIHRSAFMGKLFTKGVLGPIWRLAHWAYSQPSSLFVIDKGTLFTSLLSCEGVQQGDGLAGLLFSLGIHDSYLASLSSVTDVSGVAVMDDFYLEGPYGGVLQALDRYSTAESKKVGLSLRSEKCMPGYTRLILRSPYSMDSRTEVFVWFATPSNALVRSLVSIMPQCHNGPTIASPLHLTFNYSPPFSTPPFLFKLRWQSSVSVPSLV